MVTAEKVEQAYYDRYRWILLKNTANQKCAKYSAAPGLAGAAMIPSTCSYCIILS
jgi:hypothetical protein